MNGAINVTGPILLALSGVALYLWFQVRILRDKLAKLDSDISNGVRDEINKHQRRLFYLEEAIATRSSPHDNFALSERIDSLAKAIRSNR